MDEENKIEEVDTENKVIGGYEIVRMIGKGKFAIVYRARRISNDEVVALKRINVDQIDERAREKCLKEVRLLQSLDHPNVIRYLDSFITDNDLVIVVEWAAAGDLKRQLRKAQERGVGFEERVIWKYFSQICDAMAHMHEKRIMHRDLKPANIFLTLDGTVKVGDLGLSRELSEHTIQAHSKVGTPLYMSPEVLRGDGYDFKSDIWSLGCLLYELAMLKSPFKAEGLNLYSLFQKISQGDYQPLPEQYSTELRELAYSMISTKSEDRPDLSEVCSIATKHRALTQEKYALAKRALVEGGNNSDNGYSLSKKESGQDKLSPSTVDAIFNENTNKLVLADPKVNDIGIIGDKIDRDDRNGADRNSKYDQVNEIDRNDDDYEILNNQSKVQPSINKSRGRATRDDDDDNDDGDYDFRKPTSSKDKVSSKPNQIDRAYGSQKYDSRYDHIDQDDRNNDEITRAPRFDKQRNKNTASFKSNDTTVDIDYDEPQNASKAPVSKAPYSRPKVLKDTGKEASKSKMLKSNSNAQMVKSSDASQLNRNASENIIRDNDNIMNNNTPATADMSNSSVAFALMEMVYAKLTVLEYPMNESAHEKGLESTKKKDFRSFDRMFLPIYFACDLNAMGKIAGYQRMGNNFILQFHRFVNIVKWLCSHLDSKIQSLADKIGMDTDAPLTISKQILNIVQTVSPSPDILTVLPTSLLSGYGEKVCLVLNELCDVVLKRSPDKFGKQLKYLDEVNKQDDLIQQDQDEDEIEEDVGVDGPDDGGADDFERSLSPDLHMENPILTMVMPSVDSTLWNEELLRVTPSLLLAKKQATKESLTWASTLLKIKEHSDVLLQRQKTVQGDISSNETNQNYVINELLNLLRIQSKDLNEMRNAIERGEMTINNVHNIEKIREEFVTHQKRLNEFKANIQELEKKIELKSQQIAEIDERLEEIKEQIDSKLGTGNDDSQSGLTKLKQTIKSIKDENQLMSMSIEIITAALWNKRYVRARDIAKAKLRKQRRNQKSKYGSKDKNHDDDEDDIDIDGM